MKSVAITAAAVLATSTAAAAAAAKFTPSTATAAGTFFAGTCDIDSDGATAQLRAVHGGNGFLRFFFGAHGDETKATRALGGSIHHEIGFSDCTVRGERVVQVVFGGVEGKISYKQFIIHVM
jgi:hypothetical protein